MSEIQLNRQQKTQWKLRICLLIDQTPTDAFAVTERLSIHRGHTPERVLNCAQI